MQYEYLEKKLALKPKTLDDNDDDDDGDVERRSKRRWQPTKDIVEQKEKIRILSHCLPFSFLLLLWVICMMCSGYTNNAIDAQTLDIIHTRMHTLCVDRDAKDRR